MQELPQNRLFWPPLTIRCVECRSFGRQLLVGVCTVDRLAAYEWKDMDATCSSSSDSLAGPTLQVTAEPGQSVHVHTMYSTTNFNLLQLFNNKFKLH